MRCEDMATQSIYFNRFILNDEHTIEEIIDILTENNTSSDTEKFLVQDYNNNIIDGIFITTYVSKETTFSIENMSFESVEVVRSIGVNFSIDIGNHVIEIWGNKGNSQKLLVRLGLLFNNKVVLDSINITIPDIVKRLKKSNLTIGKVKIEDVQLQDNLIASCVFDLSNHEKPYEILNKYKDKITQVSVVFKEANSAAITVSIYSSGSIVVYRNKESIPDDTLELIKQTCIGGA